MSTDISVQGTTSSVVQLQDSGNLVFVQGNNKKVLWQSFDYPTDTLLPGIRLGLNRITRLYRFLTSWKSQDDLGTGDYFYKMKPTGTPQASFYKGSTLYWRSDPWPWHIFIITNNVISLNGFSSVLDRSRYICRRMVIFNGRNYGQYLNTGYEPKSPRDWYLRDGSEGCVKKQSMCGNGEGFVKVKRLKLPDSFNAAWMDKSMTRSDSECE
nr:g-type lectin s-receptor-like serine/threonine-protein kinase [Quercus suber]